jgi:PAS domain S-box-containing protein
MSAEIFRKKFGFLRKETEGTSPMPDWKKPRVLHVANDGGQLLTELLTRDGHEVTKADGTFQDLNLTALEQFDCIVIERPSARESVLRESEKRFRATFEQAAVGVAHSSLDGRLLLMNQKLCDILGYTPEEILTKTYQEVTHPEDLEAELEYARRLLAGEIESCSYEKRYVRKDGTLIWVNLTASVVRDEETGEPSCFVAIIEDISAGKAAQEALRESEEFNRRIVESSSDCIKILDPEGRLLYISERDRNCSGSKTPALTSTARG